MFKSFFVIIVFSCVKNYNPGKRTSTSNSLHKNKIFFCSVYMGVLPSGFEPESKPREGFMIGRYTTGAKYLLSTRGDLKDT